ncbi:Hpt domain-containing protein [Belliella buryatensis]|uniref:Hpt domain-containing protein n=1 Tax=Belliella buryatensis TaxID=1500549 RepID=A0A239EP81_9BACT|nr:Hpt domain-containing protein [Belliella buryatensis]SNS45742.1 Hpt domain-containing protein [Belliella buryatensis]
MYQIVNPQTIFQYFGDDDKEMIKEMIQIILETNLHDLKELDQYYDQNDYATVKKRCHKAKPSMSYVGALDTRKLLESIEADLENSRANYDLLKSQISIIENELRDFLEKL